MFDQQGGCQCGKVRYRVAAERSFLAACHCKECQRQSGSAIGMSLMVPLDALHIVGELKVFERSADSGRTVRCFFCPECGTRIYHQPSYADPIASIRAGTLDDTSSLVPQLHAWTSSKQPWVELPTDVPTHERQP